MSGYIRDPAEVARFLEDNYSDCKLVLYGAGLHAEEMLKNLKNNSFIVSIVKESNVEWSYYKCEVAGCRYIEEDELQNENYDYVVLLGYWSDDYNAPVCQDNFSQILIPASTL